MGADMEAMKEERMTKAVVVGSVCVIFSELSPEEIDRFKRYQPDALVMKDENNPENEFSIDIDDGPGHLEESGAVFSRAKSADGKATITILLDPSADDKLRMVQDNLGLALTRLQTMEKVLAEKTEETAEIEKNTKAMFTWI